MLSHIDWFVIAVQVLLEVHLIFVQFLLLLLLLAPFVGHVPVLLLPLPLPLRGFGAGCRPAPGRPLAAGAGVLGLLNAGGQESCDGGDGGQGLDQHDLLGEVPQGRFARSRRCALQAEPQWAAQSLEGLLCGPRIGHGELLKVPDCLDQLFVEDGQGARARAPIRGGGLHEQPLPLNRSGGPRRRLILRRCGPRACAVSFLAHV